MNVVSSTKSVLVFLAKFFFIRRKISFFFFYKDCDRERLHFPLPSFTQELISVLVPAAIQLCWTRYLL